MSTLIKELSDILSEQLTSYNDEAWKIKIIQSGDCQSYVVWNALTQEGIVVDPKLEDLQSYLKIISNLKNITWLAVIDTHTHADHVSVAANLSQKLKAPLLMHENALSKKIDIKVCKSTQLYAKAAPIEIFVTPGHTPDSVTISWGPFIFGGDTLLFGDVGRDDLPGGDAEAHYNSVLLLKQHLKEEQILLPGHDHKNGRASSWKTQLKTNSSLIQSKEDFIREAEAFNGPAPALLKESLKENFK